MTIEKEILYFLLVFTGIVGFLFIRYLAPKRVKNYDLAGYLVRGIVFGTETVLIYTNLHAAEKAQKALSQIADAGSSVVLERVYRVANR